MIDRTTKLRWRRRLKRSQRQLEDIGSQTEASLDKNFFRRLGRLYEVRRFIITWILLFVLLVTATVMQTRALGSYYLTEHPVGGGKFSEGIIGTYTNANPIYATSEVDNSVSKLLFASLLTYDADNQLTGNLADSWKADDANNRIYTVHLRSGLTWDDGASLNADDVVFTYKTIQNPDTKSPFFSSWQGIEVKKIDDLTVSFTLPNVLASFPTSLTSGLIPQHVLAKTDLNNLRSDSFNTINPVGSGPFKWDHVEVQGDTANDRVQQITLSANARYFKGKPKLNEFVVRTFLDENTLLSSFKKGELNAMADVQSAPDETDTINHHNIPMTGAVMVFYRNDQAILGDGKVRQALAMATDQQTIIKQLEHPSLPLHGPLLPGMIGYQENLRQPGLDYDGAAALLDAAGWAKGPDGMRAKDGKKLTLQLDTLNTNEYTNVANLLQKQWKRIGVNLVPSSLAQRDLQTVIDSRDYDVLLYGISMGTDPDQFAYWHSSQADPRAQRRLNFSDYKSKTADTALEAGRTRINPDLRAAKYAPFLQAWHDDVPAYALYQPRFLYISKGPLFGLVQKTVNTPTDRFNNVESWMVRTENRSLYK